MPTAKDQGATDLLPPQPPSCYMPSSSSNEQIPPPSLLSPSSSTLLLRKRHISHFVHKHITRIINRANGHVTRDISFKFNPTSIVPED